MKVENSQEKNQVKIEQETVEDFDGVQNVWHKTWLATYPSSEVGVSIEDINKYFLNAFPPERIERLKSEVRKPKEGVFNYVAKINGKVVGHFVFILDEKCDQLESIYILPEYQGRGIGRLFWEKALKLVTKNKPVKVNVMSYNQNAIDFYKKLGFVDTGIRYVDEDFVLPVSKSKFPKMDMEFIP